jgi:hypothetical protein
VLLPVALAGPTCTHSKLQDLFMHTSLSFLEAPCSPKSFAPRHSSFADPLDSFHTIGDPNSVCGMVPPNARSMTGTLLPVALLSLLLLPEVAPQTLSQSQTPSRSQTRSSSQTQSFPLQVGLARRLERRMHHLKIVTCVFTKPIFPRASLFLTTRKASVRCLTSQRPSLLTRPTGLVSRCTGPRLTPRCVSFLSATAQRATRRVTCNFVPPPGSLLQCGPGPYLLDTVDLLLLQDGATPTRYNVTLSLYLADPGTGLPTTTTPVASIVLVRLGCVGGSGHPCSSSILLLPPSPPLSFFRDSCRIK